jgi:hypothetical protein
MYFIRLPQVGFEIVSYRCLLKSRLPPQSSTYSPNAVIIIAYWRESVYKFFLIANIQISQPECKSSVVRDAPNVGFQYSAIKKEI